ncbi:TPA: hypothetical protein N0F65_001446 [Lagenidium giganteum]|uniref:C2CD3 N-terminal C2 domain-containing protein n=1 Tax=Lagenidium giganteum TaxID=4803 RepID=A0AAV2Z0M8_9STRA|nr:TPA: hypothetical protein N0F65_001446 [Lagenidium giganteum]
MMVGPVLGHVVLSVPFIMDAAVARAQLPRTNLVRVRWWGEDKPGSLFRPRLVSHDDGADVSGGARRQTARTRTNTAVPYSADVYGARSIRMRFPVCVPPERLVEYLRDMQVLTLDVVDRSTRRKYGKCVLPFQSLRQSIASNAQARQALSRLRRDQALVEIRPIETKATPAVLGYLVVNLDISWLGSESHADDDTSHLDLDEVASPLRNPSLSPALTSFSAMMRTNIAVW